MKFFEQFKELKQVPNIDKIYLYLKEQIYLDKEFDQVFINTAETNIQKYGLEHLVLPDYFIQIAQDSFIWGMIYILWNSEKMIAEVLAEAMKDNI